MATLTLPAREVEAPEVRVRVAQPSELDDVMTLALMGCEENGIVVPNAAKVLQDIYAALHLHHGVVGAIGAPGHLEGAVLLRVGSLWYSDDVIVEEKAIFIHPEYRAAK